MLKIGPHLPKLLPNIKELTFLRNGCIQVFRPFNANERRGKLLMEKL